MEDIKNIIYENGGQTLRINIGERIQIEYKDISSVISEEKFFEYLEKLFGIIDNWNKGEYTIQLKKGSSYMQGIIRIE